MKVAVVGEAPSRFMHEVGSTVPLLLAGELLADMAGVRWPGRWSELFDVRNVLPSWPGKSGKGDAFPPDLARRCADKLKMDLGAPPLIILLGRRVERAWGLDPAPFFDLRATKLISVGAGGPSLERQVVVTAPHPSKVSRWWNEASNRALAVDFWHGVAEMAREVE